MAFWDNRLMSRIKNKYVRFYGTVSVFSVPINLGQPYLGPDKSPSLLYNSGLRKLLGNCGWRVKQIPEISLSSLDHNKITHGDELNYNARNINQIGHVCNRIYNDISKEADSDNFILILGGDHCIPIGTIPGLLSKRPNTGIVWVDAHADINSPETSSSGNMHGMPLSFLLGLVKDYNSIPSMSWFKPCLNPADIVYIGLRDLDEPEKKIIKQLGIKSFTMYDIDKYGIGIVMDKCLDYFKDKPNIHLSFDIDALDPFYAPSTGTAVRGGLTFREGNYICETLSLSKKMTSMELVEVNPSLHSDIDAKTTIDMAMTLIGSTMGQTIL
eukprot:gene18570-24294_t